RRARYRRWRAPNDLAGRSVLLIDDGLASGATVRAAIQAIRERNPERLTLAVPAGAPATASALRPLVDNLVMPLAPVDFRTVGRCYENFDPAAEAEVLKALWRRSGVADATSERSPRERVGMRGEVNGRTVMLPVDGGMVAGDLAAPPQAWGVVIFAHGSGSNRQSPRNRYVAARLHRAGVATLLMDFLTEAESASGVGLLDFDLGVPARRLVSAAGWLGAQPETETLPVGLLGASAGVAAALRAGAEYPDRIQAVVGRSGRVDLAVDVLPRLRVPALLVVGQQDLDVLGLHRTARESGAVPPFDLVTVPGASHLFEEPDTLEAFVRITTGWLRRNLRFPS
ncbi:MAG: phosphoribosyltransferase family protein, partial [Chloroflexi bacterium]|nr:phosphoribosyltransferase family protein [Chloroflexota bacterium]